MRFSFESGNKTPLGTGKEKEVFVDPADSERVVTVFKEKEDVTEGIKHSPRALKGAFYLTKIAHTLLPKHVPDIYQAGESIDGQQTIDRERIEHSEGHAAMQAARQSGFNDAEEEAASQITKEIGKGAGKLDDKLEGIGLTYEIDKNAGNYTKNAEGDVFYLESFIPWRQMNPKTVDLNFDEKRMRRAIKKIADQGQRETSETYLERVLMLYKEEKQELLDNLLDSGPGIQRVEERMATFRTTHDFQYLLSIKTEAEALASEKRKAARKDHSDIFVALKALWNKTNITYAQFSELENALKELDKVIGTASRGQIDHTR